MKFGRIQPNPRFVEFEETIAAHPEWLKPWAGTFFQFQSISFPNPKDVLSGRGAHDRGGRWNPPGLATLYGSTTDTTALEECKANDRYYGVETKGPRLLVAIEATVLAMLDLTDSAIRRSLGVTLKELAAEDWRKLSQAGKESASQALGRAAAVPRGINVVGFPNAHRSDRLVVVDGDKLTRMGRRLTA